MSRFSPQGVTPDRSGEIIGAAITQALTGIGQRRRQDQFLSRQDAQTERQNAIQNAQLGEQGIHLLSPGEHAPVERNGADVAQTIASALNPSLGLPAVAAPSPRIEEGKGYYIDRGAQEAKAARAAQTQFQTILAEALAKGQAEDITNPGGRALQRRLTESEIARNERPPVTPTPRIDPLSPEGLAAQERLARVTASLRPQPTSVGPDGTPLGKPNAENLKNAAFLDIARSEDAALKDMGATVSSSALSRIPLLGNILLKHSDPKFQAQQLAGDRWIMQWLRSTSGAAISADELSNYRKQYIPQPGDTPATIRAKEAARADVERGLAKMAGAAAPRGDVNLGDTAGKTITVNGKTFKVPE